VFIPRGESWYGAKFHVLRTTPLSYVGAKHITIAPGNKCKKWKGARAKCGRGKERLEEERVVLPREEK
jgi:hypothetical protein